MIAFRLKDRATGQTLDMCADGQVMTFDWLVPRKQSYEFPVR